MLLRLAYLGMANVFALLRLLPMSGRDEDAEILALRYQLSVLQRQLGRGRVRFTPADRVLLAALLHRLPRDVLKRLHLVVRPDTVLRWHRDVVAWRHAQRSRPRHPGRPRTGRSVRVLVLRLVATAVRRIRAPRAGRTDLCHHAVVRGPARGVLRAALHVRRDPMVRGSDPGRVSGIRCRRGAGRRLPGVFHRRDDLSMDVPHRPCP